MARYARLANLPRNAFADAARSADTISRNPPKFPSLERAVRLIGHVDRIESGRLAGWAADADDPARVVEITILLDGREHSRVRADQFRSDLRALKTLGTGEHAFDATWLPDLTARSRQEIRVVFSESKTLVPNGFAFVDTGVRRSGRPRYILHIGPHKTGTKYLQTILSEQDQNLQSRGIRYPRLWQIQDDDPSHATLVRRIAAQDPTLQTEILAQEDKGTRLIILSSEEFADLNDKSVAFLASLLQDADVEIVFYCRRWSQLLYSGWMETIKHGDDRTLPEYVAAHASNPFGSTVVNYALNLDRFAANFGRDRIRLISYTNLVESKTDLFRHFAKALLDWPDAPADDRNINPHLSLQENELLRALNSLHKQARHATPSIYPRYLEYQDQLDLSSLFAIMQKDVAQLKLNEAVPGFSTVHEMLIRKYGDRLLPPCSGSAIFDPTLQRLSFVRNTWLLSSRSVNMLNKIYKHLTQTRVRSAALA